MLVCVCVRRCTVIGGVCVRGSAAQGRFFTQHAPSRYVCESTFRNVVLLTCTCSVAKVQQHFQHRDMVDGERKRVEWRHYSRQRRAATAPVQEAHCHMID